MCLCAVCVCVQCVFVSFSVCVGVCLSPPESFGGALGRQELM